MDIQIPISQKEQKAGITLQEQIDIPIQQPEYSYLNQFIDREDTTWQEIVLAEDGWDYKQEGLTPAGAAIVGGQTVGAMAGAAFSSLTNLASVSLINNQGDVEAILKELGPKDNVKQLTLAITSAGISHKIDKSLELKGIDITQTGFDQRLVKVIANSTSTSLLQTAVYGSDFEENLKKNLRMQFATVATQDTFSNIVKDLDGDTLSDNITHKLAAGLTSCLSAKAAGNRCEAGSIGAVVGEMWGDYQVDDSNTLTQAQKDKLINQAKLIAGITAAFAGEDVNVAAGVAAEAVRWNAININKVKANAPKANQEEADKIAVLFNTGNLEVNKENLDYLYQINTNKDLTILVEADYVGKVLMTGSWESIEDGSGNLKVTVRPINLLKWAVFGTLTLVKRTNGTYGFYDDIYNFEMHNSLRPDELLRNANTKIGSPTCGSLSGCIGFNISFNKTNYNPKNIINLSD
ncbi:DUF637 domain-containing protein [Moraxella catarrhalis]|uniref:DUF637 domain-containing protein n=3 Tax=Moraxella catarrhalis TaxID=480 RepID=UPI000202ABF8|nr:DUF637 domain-containing protein [Moraxella catarrhalis]EGE22122.1 FHA-like protein [Moraxella catarrhalis CO72]MPW88737.1 hypothetical protein [Moraxella catarrhalis]MPX67915.1 hypothetical protein [Moraxella catarrhalis]